MIIDPIADMLTRLRNAITAKQDSVIIPASKEKEAIANILLEEGYVKSVEKITDKSIKSIKVEIKYDENGNSAIFGLKRISKPGLRVYASIDKLPKVIGGMGISIISTNKGILTDKKARELKVGGEVLAYVW